MKIKYFLLAAMLFLVFRPNGVFGADLVKNSDTTDLYPYIQNAYNNASSGQSLLMRATDFAQDLNLNKDIVTTLLGGCGSDFTSTSGFTVIHGKVIISSGTVTMSNVAITTAASRIMFFSSNWGDHSIRITDDINSLANGATATPRIITGSNVPLFNPAVDSLTVDRSRGMVYVSDSTNINIIVYHNTATATGNNTPDRTIAISSASAVMSGIAIDSGRDRLYIAGYNGSRCVFIINNASTKNGTVTADAVLTVPSEAIFLDQQNDRLYVGKNIGAGGNGEVYVYDNASSLTTGAAPNRTITLPEGIPAYSVWVDAATDKLYYGSRNMSSNGYNLFVFNNAGNLSGTKDPDADSAARFALNSLVNAMVDNGDRLYMWDDSATHVHIYNNASTLSGAVSTDPDKTISDVVHSGYGMDYLNY